jgi:hypothetical protein
MLGIRCVGVVDPTWIKERNWESFRDIQGKYRLVKNINLPRQPEV